MMSFEFSMPLFWLAAAIAFVIVEALTMGLTTIWFAGGSAAALIVSLLDANLAVQLIVFFVASIGLLVPTRKLFVKKLQTGNEKTNVEALIGKTALVTTEIKPYEVGAVKVNGQIWSAVTKPEGESLSVGSKVTITAIEGVKLIVAPIDVAEL